MTNLIAALPDLALGGAFLLTWIFPLALGERMVAYFMLLMLLEFITVHSAAFMGRVVYSDATGSKKTVAVVGLGLFYTVFVGAFALMFKVWWPRRACQSCAGTVG